MITARPRLLRLYENSSAPEKVRAAVSTYTGFSPPNLCPGTSSAVQNSFVCPVRRSHRLLRCVLREKRYDEMYDTIPGLPPVFSRRSTINTRVFARKFIAAEATGPHGPGGAKKSN